MVFGNKVYPWPDQYMVFERNSAHVQKRTGMIDKNVLANLNGPAKVGVKWSKNSCAVVQGITNNFT